MYIRKYAYGSRFTPSTRITRGCPFFFYLLQGGTILTTRFIGGEVEAITQINRKRNQPRRDHERIMRDRYISHTTQNDRLSLIFIDTSFRPLETHNDLLPSQYITKSGDQVRSFTFSRRQWSRGQHCVTRGGREKKREKGKWAWIKGTRLQEQLEKEGNRYGDRK